MPKDVLGGGDAGLPPGGPGVLTRAIADGEATWGLAPPAEIVDGSITNAKVNASAAIAESKLNLASDAAAGTPSRRTLGTGATQAAAGDHSHTGLTEQAAGTPSVRAIGSTGTTVVAGNDSRLSAGAAGTATVRALGTGATEAAAGNDARLTDARTPTDASVTVAKLAAGALAAIKGVAVHNGTSYPSRPTGFASVEWIGPTDPGGSALNGDTWVPTAGP